MPAVAADLAISSRWILPMTSAADLLEHHTVVVRNGRILDLLPTAEAADRYAPSVNVNRSQHLLLPGLVNAGAMIGPRANAAAAMLKSGTTCFCSVGYYPEEVARQAERHGLRAVIGIPIAEDASAWAATPPEYLTRALSFRDRYRGHPTVATVFAPQTASALSDVTFRRIATLADELDAGISIALHESAADVAECIIRHGVRPLERMRAFGLLTPALTAVHMVQVDAGDIMLAARSGIAIVLCVETDVRAGHGPPPVCSWVAGGLRVGLGTGRVEAAAGTNLWNDMRSAALVSRLPGASEATLSAWQALALGTIGGAAALGLEGQIGTLEPGKWADLCCADLQHPAIKDAAAGLEHELVDQILWNGGRDLVSDVWVAGRHLVGGGNLLEHGHA